jgi:chromosome segregation ATPase
LEFTGEGDSIMSDKLDQILNALQGLQSGQERMEVKIETMEARIGTIEAGQERMEARIGAIEAGQGRMESELRVIREQTARNAEIIPVVEKFNERLNSNETDIKLFKKLLTS